MVYMGKNLILFEAIEFTIYILLLTNTLRFTSLLEKKKLKLKIRK